MIRAILKMFGWFLYSIFMLAQYAVCMIFQMLLQSDEFFILSIACAICTLIGIFNLMAVKVEY